MNRLRPFLLHLSGARACFRRPEFTCDFVSYDVSPPLAVERIVNSAYPLPDNRWQLSKLTVLNPIRFDWISLTTARGERRALVLLDVAYVAELTVTATNTIAAPAAPKPSARGHLGMPDFPAELTAITEGDLPRSALDGTGVRELGWLPTRIIGGTVSYRRTIMRDGVIDLAKQDLRLSGS